MLQSDKPTNYEEVYNGLVDRLARADYRHAMLHLGFRDAGCGAAVEVLGRTCLVGPEGVTAADSRRLDVTIRICLAYYVLQGGLGGYAGNWLSYRDFKDGAFFHSAFTQTVEGRIARDFSGKISLLSEAALALGGEKLEPGLGGDFCLRFPVLPKVPLALVFYDADDDFPSSARVLFDSSAPLFLDMECLAGLGWILADQLALAARAKGASALLTG